MHLNHKKLASKNVNWCYKKTIKTNYSVKRVLLDMQISLKTLQTLQQVLLVHIKWYNMKRFPIHNKFSHYLSPFIWFLRLVIMTIGHVFVITPNCDLDLWWVAHVTQWKQI